MIERLDLGTVPIAGVGATAGKAAQPEGSTFHALIRAAAETATEADKATKVDGHQYAKVEGGTHDGMYVNQTANARKGELFKLVSRDGREFHVYGTGKDAKIFEVKGKADAAATTDTGTVDATKTTGTTTAGTTTAATTTAGTTTTTAKAAA